MVEKYCDDDMCIEIIKLYDILIDKGLKCITREQFKEFINYTDFDGDGKLSLCELDFIFSRGIMRGQFEKPPSIEEQKVNSINETKVYKKYIKQEDYSNECKEEKYSEF